MTMKSTFLSAVAIATLALLSTSIARADTISIGLQEAGVNGGALTTVATGPGSASFSGAYGTFTLNNTSGTGSPFLPQPELDSGTVNASSAAAGTLWVEVTETGLTGPLGAHSLLSSFTSNILAGSITSVVEATYADATDAAYGMGTPLDSATFPTIAVSASVDGINFAAPYSETEVFRITAAGVGNTSDTIQISRIARAGNPLPVRDGIVGPVGTA